VLIASSHDCILAVYHHDLVSPLSFNLAQMNFLWQDASRTCVQPFQAIYGLEARDWRRLGGVDGNSCLSMTMDSTALHPPQHVLV